MCLATHVRLQREAAHVHELSPAYTGTQPKTQCAALPQMRDSLDDDLLRGSHINSSKRITARIEALPCHCDTPCQHGAAETLAQGVRTTRMPLALHRGTRGDRGSGARRAFKLAV